MSYEIKNVYTIFFASSITELEIERLRLTNFVNKLSGDYLEQFFEIRLKPVICEDEDPCMAHAGKQTEYDDAIRESRMCFFVFHKKVGKYTEHELEVAKAAFDKTELPKIYFFFKKPQGEQFSEGVAALQAKLDKDFGHYYTFFEDIDTVHLRIVLQIMRQVLPEVSIELKNGQVLARNMPIPDVDPMSLPEFRNNKDLARMREEYAALDAECRKLYEQFKQPDCPADIIAEYSRKAAKRARLKEETEQLLANIFNISKEICSESGVVDAKRRAAYRYLEEGDSKKALEMLDEGELLAEGERLLSKAREARAEAQSLIDAWKLRIDILLTMTGDKERFAKVRAAYETIEKLVDEVGVGAEKIRDYAIFLDNQNDHKLAHDKALKYVHLLEGEAKKVSGKNVTDEALCDAYDLAGGTALSLHKHDVAWNYLKNALEIAQHLNKFARWRGNKMLGSVCDDINDFDRAYEYYKEALTIIEELYETSHSEYASDLAATYVALGNLQFSLNKYSKAREYYEKTLKIEEQLYAQNSSAHASDLATLYNNLGNLYLCLKKYDIALRWCEQAREIKEEHYAENPYAHAPGLSNIYHSLGILCGLCVAYNKAIEWYEKALKIKKQLYDKNPTAYASDLARIYINLGIMCRNSKEYGKARVYYKKALGIYEKHQLKNVLSNAPDLAIAYLGIGNTCNCIYKLEEAREWYEKALELWDQLYSKYPSAYAPNLAMTYNNLGKLHYNLKEYGKAREYYEEALKIMAQLCAESPSAYGSNLADTYNDLGAVYYELKEYDKARKYLEKAFEIRKKLNAQNPSAYAPDLARICNNLGVLHRDLKEYDKAREYYEKAVEMFEELYAEDASAHAENLTGVYCDLARCCEAMGETELAKEYRDKAAAVK